MTGGIGAGKSAVASRLVELGAVLIDSDRLAREVVAAGTEGFAQVAAAFGPSVVASDGGLDRPALGAIVFADPFARARLERIVHPLVRARTAELTAAAPPGVIVVNDVPLLVEAGLAPTYHLVVVVAAATSTRVDRLVRTRRMTEEQAGSRISAQADDQTRLAAADVVLPNDGSLNDLHAAVDMLWNDRLVPYEAALRAHRPAAVVRSGDRVLADRAAANRLAARIRHVVGDGELEQVSTAAAGLELRMRVPSGTGTDEVARQLAPAGLFPCPDAPDGQILGSADPGLPATVRLETG